MADNHANAAKRRTLVLPRLDGSELLVDEDPDDPTRITLGTRNDADADLSTVTMTRREPHAVSILTREPGT